MDKILPVYPWPMHPVVAEQLALLDGVTPVQALPGGPAPVLAIRTPPPFVCDAIVVLEPQRLTEGVHLALRDGIELALMREMLNATSEMIEPIVSKVAFS